MKALYFIHFSTRETPGTYIKKVNIINHYMSTFNIGFIKEISTLFCSCVNNECITLYQQNTMFRPQGSLKHRPGEQSSFWCGAVTISPPCMKQTRLQRYVLLTRTTNAQHTHSKRTHETNDTQTLHCSTCPQASLGVSPLLFFHL